MSRTPLVDDETGCQYWNLPDLGNPAVTGDTSRDAMEAYEEGFEQGRREGFEAGREEVVAQAQRLEQLMRGLAQPFEELDREVEEGLVALTFAIVRRLVHVEIQTSPEQIMSVVNEAVALLPSSSRDVELYLHPEDARLMHDLLPDTEGGKKWQIIEDVSLQQGGCVVKTRASRIDASVEARLENIMSSLLHVESSQEETA